jgi:hypothetical protein
MLDAGAAAAAAVGASAACAGNCGAWRRCGQLWGVDIVRWGAETGWKGRGTVAWTPPVLARSSPSCSRHHLRLWVRCGIVAIIVRPPVALFLFRVGR